MLSNLDNSSRSKCQDNSKHYRSRFKAEAKKKDFFCFWNETTFKKLSLFHFLEHNFYQKHLFYYIGVVILSNEVTHAWFFDVSLDYVKQ